LRLLLPLSSIPDVQIRKRPFKAIILEAMPGKFGDTSKEFDLFDDTEIWIDQFQNAAQINGWSESEAIIILS
jgi:hypothetical protein